MHQNNIFFNSFLTSSHQNNSKAQKKIIWRKKLTNYQKNINFMKLRLHRCSKLTHKDKKQRINWAIYTQNIIKCWNNTVWRYHSSETRDFNNVAVWKRNIWYMLRFKTTTIDVAVYNHDINKMLRFWITTFSKRPFWEMVGL